MLLFVSSKKKKNSLHDICITPIVPTLVSEYHKMVATAASAILVHLSPVFDDQDWHPTILYPVISPNE